MLLQLRVLRRSHNRIWPKMIWPIQLGLKPSADVQPTPLYRHIVLKGDIEKWLEQQIQQQTLHENRKHWALRPQKPVRLIRDGEVEGSGVLYLTPTLSPLEWFCIKVGSCVSHFNVSVIVWAKSQDTVHKPIVLKRRERRAEADRTKVLLLTSQAPYR